MNRGGRCWIFVLWLLIVPVTVFCGCLDHCEPVGRGARLFITKCYPGQGRLTDNDFRQLSDAGFTLVVNRWQKNVQAYCEGAAKAGLDVMTWQGGMTIAGDPGARHITRLGKPRKYVASYSQAGWDKLTEKLLKNVKLSLTCRNYRGVILDFEIYGGEKTGAYCESYDDDSFTRFLKSEKLKIADPLPPPDQRHGYLAQLGLVEKYVNVQAALVAEQAASLRKKIDEVNPRFQFGVYQRGPLIEAVRRNLATPSAPLLLISCLTYGRSLYSRNFKGGYDPSLPDRPGLKLNLVTAMERLYQARECDYPATVLAGHYPQAPGPADGTQFTFTARQAFNSAAYADGYWIWTDWYAPPPWKSKQAWIDAMMASFKQANAALDAGDYTWAARYPEQIKDPNAVRPLLIATGNGTSGALWNPLTGERIADENMRCVSQQCPQLDNKELRVNGLRVDVMDQGQLVKSFPVGHALRAIAVGEVDGQVGAEVVTLNAGWVKIWDPQSQALLLRFFVGHDQNCLQLIQR